MRFEFLAFLLFFGLFMHSAEAQQPSAPTIPIIDSAESVFSTGIQAYRDGEFEVAARLFGVAASTYDWHQKTTASLLMQGKSLFQNSQFEDARQVLEQLLRTYPTTRYADEARHVISMAGDSRNQSYQQSQIFLLGVALPLNGDAAGLTQQLFNGIRMAVQQYNAAAFDSLTGEVGPKIRMIFRDTQNDAQAARQAIRDLVEIERVGAIIGPLFSDEAVAAAQEAERTRVVMLAPLATEDAVSRNREYVFQANPTLTKRGELMARFAARGLGIENVGIITDYNNAESVKMARGFEQEMAELEVDLPFNEFISDTRSWFRLSDSIERDTLLKADAIYLPINGGNASTLIGGVLGSLDRMGLGSHIRILGDVEWHNLPMVTLAGNYMATYSNDFYVDPADSTGFPFIEQYLAATGEEPQRLAYTGYDVTSFLANLVNRQKHDPRPLNQLIRTAGPYQGYGIRLDFTNGNVNEAMYYHRYRDGLVELLR